MKKWFKSVLSFFKDLMTFVHIRRQQRTMYGAIIEDLENIQELSDALNLHISEFAKKWNVFDETKGLLDKYRSYISESREMYQETRVQIINNLLAEKNKRLIAEDPHTQEKQLRVAKYDFSPKRMLSTMENEMEAWEKFYHVLERRSKMLARMLESCDMEKRDNSIIVTVGTKNKLTLRYILANKIALVLCCQEVFGKDVAVDIVQEEDDGEGRGIGTGRVE